MNRRTYLGSCGIALASSLAGCLSGANDESPDENTDAGRSPDGSTTNGEPDIEGREGVPAQNRNNCSFHVEIVEEPPTDAPVVDAGERDLRQVGVIRRALDRATNPDETHPTSIRSSGSYETFTVDADSSTEFDEATATLNSLNSYENDDYPPGVYIEHDATTVAITLLCAT